MSALRKEAQLPAKFQLKKGPTGKYRFVVLASNGQVVATSEAYERKASALAGIKSIEKIVHSQAAVEDTTTKEYMAAEAAKKDAKKNGARKAPAKAAKKLVTKAKEAAPAKTAAAKASPSSTRAAKAAVKGAAKSGTRTPVRKAPPPLTTPPSQLTPKI